MPISLSLKDAPNQGWRTQHHSIAQVSMQQLDTDQMQQRFFWRVSSLTSRLRYWPANMPSFLAYWRVLGILMEPDQFMQLKHWLQISSSSRPSSRVESEQATLQQVGFTVPRLHCWATRQNSKFLPTASELISVPELGLRMFSPFSRKNFWDEFLSSMMQVRRMGSWLLETLFRISLVSTTSAWMEAARSILMVPFLMMRTSAGGDWLLSMYQLRQSKMISFMQVLSACESSTMYLEQKQEKSLLLFEQQETIVFSLHSLSLVNSTPISSTPTLAIFLLTFGTQSLLPTLAAICSSTLVKMEAEFFLRRLVVMVAWLFISTPSLRHMRLRLLQWFLKLGGMMNQQTLEVLSSLSFLTHFSICFRACLQSPQFTGFMNIQCFSPSPLQVDSMSFLKGANAKSSGQNTDIFRAYSRELMNLLKSMKLVALNSSTRSRSPSCSSGGGSCFAVMDAGVVLKLIPSFQAMVLGLQSLSTLLILLNKSQICSSFLSGATMVLSLTSFLFLSSKSQGSPPISTNSGTKQMTSLFSPGLDWLETAWSRGCFLDEMMTSQVRVQYYTILTVLSLWVNWKVQRLVSKEIPSIRQHRFLPQLAMTVLFISSCSTSARFSVLDSAEFILQILLMRSRALSDCTILTVGSTFRKSPPSSRQKLVEQP